MLPKWVGVGGGGLMTQVERTIKERERKQNIPYCFLAWTELVENWLVILGTKKKDQSTIYLIITRNNLILLVWNVNIRSSNFWDPHWTGIYFEKKENRLSSSIHIWFLKWKQMWTTLPRVISDGCLYWGATSTGRKIWHSCLSLGKPDNLSRLSHKQLKTKLFKPKSLYNYLLVSDCWLVSFTRSSISQWTRSSMKDRFG